MPSFARLGGVDSTDPFPYTTKEVRHEGEDAGDRSDRDRVPDDHRTRGGRDPVADVRQAVAPETPASGAPACSFPLGEAS